MLKRYTDKLAPYAPVLLRLTVGVIFLAHGLIKTQDPASVVGFFEFLKLPMPAMSAWFILLLEVGGGAGLILGLGTRWFGILFAIEMIVATIVFKLSVGFIAAPAAGAGYELDLLLLVGSLALVLLGSGPLSIERNVLKREL